MMYIVDIVQLKFPGASLQKDVIIQDDGQGAYIKEWNLGSPKPTDEDLAAWAIEVEPEYNARQARIANEPIYKQLEELDLKSIRALRTNDTERLAALEAQAQALRDQLL